MSRTSTFRARTPRLRVAVTLTILLLASPACVPAAPADDPATTDLAALAALDLDALAADQVLRTAREFTVRIRTLGCDRLGTGSGFVLDDGVIVTNRHVVGQPREITISTWDGRSFDAVVEGIALDADLAVIKVVSADLPVATLRTTPVEIGEPIVVIGYPGGGPSTITSGKVLGFTDGPVLGERTPAIVVDAEVRQGNSGGPLIDMRGAVVGVIFALSRDSGNGLAVPVDVLLERLETRGFRPPEGC
jgi:S1-C subfamily serine protease